MSFIFARPKSFSLESSCWLRLRLWPEDDGLGEKWEILGGDGGDKLATERNPRRKNYVLQKECRAIIDKK